MNELERLNLQKMIQANDTENTTGLIRQLKTQQTNIRRSRNVIEN